MYNETEEYLSAMTMAFRNGAAFGRRSENEKYVSLGLRYTSTGRFRDTPRDDIESDAPLYTTPREVWENEWAPLWRALVAEGDIDAKEAARIGAELYDMAGKNTAGVIRQRTSKGVYLWEVFPIEIFARPV